VHAAQTGCLSPCNLGPTMVVYPEGIWYCELSAAAIDRIVDEHFVGGRVVEEYAREPGRHDERPVPEGAR
jgi:(2Fe-2S) ferredoxin